MNQNGYKVEFILLNKGDFLIWDTRHLHCNTKCYAKNAKRIVSYICISPKLKNVKIDEKRKQALSQRRCSRHFHQNFFKTFPKYPRFNEDVKFREKIDIINNSFYLSNLELELI